MEHETYTLEGIRAALRMIDETRDKINHKFSYGLTHVLVDIAYLHGLLNDIEDYITGNLEDEVE